MSVTINGTSYDLTYVNVASDFKEKSGAILSVDAWGMDSLRRTFSGRLDKVATELIKYKRNRDKRDTVYADLYLSDYAMVESAPFAELTVTYKGILGGSVGVKLPDPVFKSGNRAQTAQLKYTADDGDDTDETTTLSYYAPYTTAHYVLDKKPTRAKYRNAIQVTKDSLQIYHSTGRRDRNIIFGPDFNGGGDGRSRELPRRSGYANGVVQVFTASFEFHEIAGKWWEVTETNEARIVPPSLAVNAMRNINQS
jgi:hypothetical protein